MILTNLLRRVRSGVSVSSFTARAGLALLFGAACLFGAAQGAGAQSLVVSQTALTIDEGATSPQFTVALSEDSTGGCSST